MKLDSLVITIGLWGVYDFSYPCDIVSISLRRYQKGFDESIGTEITNKKKLKMKQARMGFRFATSSSNYHERKESLVLKHYLLKPLV